MQQQYPPGTYYRDISRAVCIFVVVFLQEDSFDYEFHLKHAFNTLIKYLPHTVCLHTSTYLKDSEP